MNGYAIRHAVPTDLPTVHALGQHSLGLKCTLSELESEVAKSQVVVAVLHLDSGGVVGYINAWWAADELELTEVVVSSNHQRNGYGRALLSWLCTYAVRRGGRMIHLEVRKSNTSAIQLYRSFGFEHVGERRAYYRDGEDASLYSLALSVDDSEGEG